MTAPTSLRRAGLAMAAGTALSRVTGLVRTAALAAALGVTSLADAYNIANTVPTILLVLVTGGTLSAVLVPLLVEKDEPAERRRRAEDLGALVLVVTGVASLLAAAASPLVARLFATGLRGEPQYAEFVSATTLFLVLFAPQVLAYGVSVHAVAVLNAAGRLALGSFASVATNIVTVAAIGLYVVLRPAEGTGGTRELVVLGGGTTLGVVVMTAIQVWGARRIVPGMRLVPRVRRNETTSRVLRLGTWTVLYVAANQVGLAVVLTVAASRPGGASAYQWAFALMQLPFAIIAVSVLSAVYPQVSRAARTDVVRYAALVSGGLRVLLLLLLPAAVLLVVLATPLTQLLLGYGAVDTDGVVLIASAVGVFGLALLPFTAFQLLTRACYARGDTRSPAVVNVAVNVVSVAGALLALLATGDSAVRTLVVLVAAYAASYLTGCVLLARRLSRQAPGVLAGLGRLSMRLVLPAAALVGAALGGQALVRAAAPDGDAVLVAAVELAVVGAVAVAAYLLALRLLAPAELRTVLRRTPTPS